jgi:hypothetical protein
VTSTATYRSARLHPLLPETSFESFIYMLVLRKLETSIISSTLLFNLEMIFKI